MTAAGSAGGAPWAELAPRIAATLGHLAAARGVSVGCSAKQAVWRRGRTILYRYEPLAADTVAGARAPRRPLLICFALVNRPYVLDLQPDRSLVRRLLEAQLDVYLIDWGDPDGGDGRLDLECYIEERLGGAVQHLRERCGGQAPDLLGVCQGGVLSLAYTALHPQHVARLVTLTTPVDFHTSDNLLAKWARGLDTALLESCGAVPGELLNGLFLALMPVRLMQEKYVRLLLGSPGRRAVEDFVRMEKWIFDSPAQAGPALAQFVRWCYQENRLVRDALELGGRRVRLGAIRQPLLNLYALNDHIVPASACAALGRCVGSRAYAEWGVPTGHIGMYVSRAGQGIAPRIIEWLGAAAPRRRATPRPRPAPRPRSAVRRARSRAQ